MVAPLSKGRLFHDIVSEVFRLRSVLLAGSERVSAAAGLTSARWQVLGAIADVPATASQVARRLGLTRQAIGVTAEGMARDGLVTFLDHPDHKRARPMTPTPRARRALAVLDARETEFASLMGAAHSREALQTTLEVLRASRTAIQARLDAEEDE